jgi:DNA modification methylase
VESERGFGDVVINKFTGSVDISDAIESEIKKLYAPIVDASYELFLESKTTQAIGEGFDPDELSDRLFPFQRDIVRWALRKGKVAVFADTGLGKSIIQLEWAKRVAAWTFRPVLILAPLAVAKQTAAAAPGYGIDRVVYARTPADIGDAQIVLTNYERLDAFSAADFGGVVLDESSILKNFDGKTRTRIIEAFANTPFRLACTATPAPNDTTELGNHAEFLGVMTRPEMLAMYFFHDGGDTSKWTLKGHARGSFWKWIASWGCVVRKPSDVSPDYDDEQFRLPPIEYHVHTIAANPDAAKEQGRLFVQPAQTLTEQRKARRATLEPRCELAASLVSKDDACLVWCELNDESHALADAIEGAEETLGTDKEEEKERKVFGFTIGAPRVMVTKAKVAGTGMNYQHCAHMIFVGITHSFEQYYQAVRRCYRFGQRRPVRVDIVTSELEGKVLENLKRKESEAAEMSEEMVALTREQMRIELGTASKPREQSYSESTKTGADWTMHHGDCVEVIKRIPDASVDFTIFSPPFASLYTYSDSMRDFGNCASHDEFYEHFNFLAPQLLRITKPGRLLAFHCMCLPTSKSRDGVIGLTDFPGILIRSMQNAGWIFHSKVTIWKDPVTAMQRTHALGLLYKQLRKDSCMSRQGIPDELIVMRAPGVNANPVSHESSEFSVEQWQKYASPVWMDIDPSDTLQKRSAREDADERHICPLQLEVIRRSLLLWTNPGDLVFSPFGGIGSEGYVSIAEGRQFLGVELKESYWKQACLNLEAISVGTKKQLGLAL